MAHRQPPGGTSTLSFGDEPSPFAKEKSAANGKSAMQSPLNMSGAFSSTGAGRGGNLNDETKHEIHELVDEAEDVDDLLSKLAELLSTPVNLEVSNTAGSESLTQTHVATTRGFKPSTQKVEAAIASLKEALKKRGADSLARLAKKFKIMDDNNSRSLCYDELKKGLVESGCKLEEGAMQALFRYLDADCTGDVSIDEFFQGVRGQLNSRRAAMVQQAFEALDVNDDGALTVSDLQGQYDCSRHPDVVAGTATDVEVLQNFLSGFDGTMGTVTKIVTPEKFAAYYAGVSASIDDDDYFELMIRNVWHIAGGEGACENTTCRRLLVTHDDGSQSIEVLENDIEVSKEDLQEMKRRLVEQGVPVVKIALYGDLTDGDATTSSPRKKANPLLEKEGDVIVAKAFKDRMAHSSVTF